MIHTNVTQLVGHTPLLELTKLEKENDLKAKVVVKLELFNPAGSVKDRIAKGMIEAAESMGNSPGEIIWRVYLREAVPGITRGVTITLISLINFTAVAGTIGAGGLGTFAIMYGHGKNLPDITVAVIAIIIVLVSAVQAAGSWIVKKTTH